MRKQLVIILLLIFTQPIYGQKDNSEKAPPSRRTKTEIDNHNCIKKSVISLTERLEKYPFNVASRIVFGSFEHGTYLLSGHMEEQDNKPVGNDSIIYSKLKEVKTVTRFQIDQLTDLFYNYGYKGPLSSFSEAGCYMPRNAVLFLDERGKIVEIIEICFECGKMYASSDKMSFGEMCDQKMEMLFNLFRKAGITYGITKGRLLENDK